MSSRSLCLLMMLPSIASAFVLKSGSSCFVHPRTMSNAPPWIPAPAPRIRDLFKSVLAGRLPSSTSIRMADVVEPDANTPPPLPWTSIAQYEVDALVKTAEAAARAAGAIIVANLGAPTMQSNESAEVKTNIKDVVTRYDREAQKAIEAVVRSSYPHHKFLGEEDVAPGSDASRAALDAVISDDYVWIADPIDGTANFASGMPLCGVIVAVLYHGEPVIGVIYDPHRDEMFISTKDGGATMINGNGQRVPIIAITGVNRLSDAVMNVGCPADPKAFACALRGVEALSPKCRGLRTLAVASLSLAWVACGRLTGYISYDLNSWDLVAGALMVQEAGGVVTQLDGSPYTVRTRDMLVSNGCADVHNECLRILKEADAVTYRDEKGTSDSKDSSNHLQAMSLKDADTIEYRKRKDRTTLVATPSIQSTPSRGGVRTQDDKKSKGNLPMTLEDGNDTKWHKYPKDKNTLFATVRKDTKPPAPVDTTKNDETDKGNKPISLQDADTTWHKYPKDKNTLVATEVKSSPPEDTTKDDETDKGNTPISFKDADTNWHKYPKDKDTLFATEVKPSSPEETTKDDETDKGNAPISFNNADASWHKYPKDKTVMSATERNPSPPDKTKDDETVKDKIPINFEDADANWHKYPKDKTTLFATERNPSPPVDTIKDDETAKGKIPINFKDADTNWHKYPQDKTTLVPSQVVDKSDKDSDISEPEPTASPQTPEMEADTSNSTSSSQTGSATVENVTEEGEDNSEATSTELDRLLDSYSDQKEELEEVNTTLTPSDNSKSKPISIEFDRIDATSKPKVKANVRQVDASSKSGEDKGTDKQRMPQAFDKLL